MKPKTKVYPLIGFESMYTIDTMGNIYDIDKNKFIKSYKHGRGYRSIVLRGVVKNSKKNRLQLLHRVLALQFIPNPENKPCVNHKDGIKSNNNLSNLEWATYSENNQHAFDFGLKKSCDRYYPVLDNHPRAKMTIEKAAIARNMFFNQNIKRMEIAIHFGVCKSVIDKIIQNKTW